MLRKPKIAYIWPDCSKANGAGRYIHEISQRINNNFEVHIIAASWDGDSHPEIKFQKIPLFFNISSYLGVAEFVMKSSWLAKKNNYDLILGQGLPLSGLNFQDIIFVHVNSPQFVSWKYDFRGTGLNNLMRRSIYFFHPLMLTNTYLRYRKENFERIIVASGVVERELTSLYGVPSDRIEIIPLGVGIDEFHPGKRDTYRDEIRKRYNIAPKEFLLFFCAQNFEIKGLPLIIKTLNLLNRNDITLIVAGKGENNGMVRARRMVSDLGLGEKVIFLGSISNADQYYAASDIFILPTLYDTFGLVVLEAMASGLPVIVSGRAGVSELIKDGKCGLILKDPGDCSELASKISMLANNSALLKSIGLEARSVAESNSWEIVAEKTARSYFQVLEKKLCRDTKRVLNENRN